MSFFNQKKEVNQNEGVSKMESRGAGSSSDSNLEDQDYKQERSPSDRGIYNTELQEKWQEWYGKKVMLEMSGLSSFRRALISPGHIKPSTVAKGLINYIYGAIQSELGLHHSKSDILDAILYSVVDSKFAECPPKLKYILEQIKDLSWK